MIEGPTGKVIPIMTDLLEPGGGHLEFPEAFAAYRDECTKRNREPVGIEVFAIEMRKLCQKARIKVEVEDGRPRLVRVQLKR